MILYEVAVAAPVSDTLTYGPPEQEHFTELTVGSCVTVPLGRRRHITGYVMGKVPAGDHKHISYTVKPISEVLFPEPVFPVELAELYRWVARYYHYPIGEVIRTALSAVPAPKRGYVVRLTETGVQQLDGDESLRLADSGEQWLGELISKGELPPAAVARIRKNAPQNRKLEQLVQQGTITLTHETLKAVTGIKRETVYEPSDALAVYLGKDVGTHENVGDYVNSFERQLKPAEKRALTTFADLFTSGGGRPVFRRTLLKYNKNYSQALLSLTRKNILVKQQQRVYRNPFGEALEPEAAPEITLTPEQQDVLEQVIPAVRGSEFIPFLLFGVTGCGKTEVYLQAAEAAVLSGKTALILVPEIALASQMENQFHARFGQRLALMHSGMTNGERLDQRQRILQGKARVVLGARSAVFAPLENLGIIIVDEEHEPSYKQDDGVRYHGRDVAVKRAQMAQCPVLLGSATPSVTSFANAQNGKYTLLTMDKRVEERELPEVELVDLAHDRKKRQYSFFSEVLVNNIRSTLENGHQVLLFVNRRGFSSCMLCRDCGHVLQCMHCRVSLTYHRNRGQLLCHYCGFTLTKNILCPECNSDKIEGVGLGVERIEEEVKQLFPSVRVARLDSDVASKRKNYLATLKAVRDREVDILVGTQMIAKGLHFPGITLVGVVWADAGLNVPDYKAAERTFSILSQVTGRAGRGDHPGKVIIQTDQPHHYAVRFAQQHNYVALFDEETGTRSLLGFPPFGRMINLKFSGLDEKKVESSARKTFSYLAGRNTDKKVELLGPVPAPLAKIKDRYRWQLMLKGGDIPELHRFCEMVLAEKKRLLHHTVRLGVDVDPENMM